MPPPELALRLLGRPAWRLGCAPWRPLSRLDAALLARLALHGKQARTTLAAWLWPGVTLPRAHANLRQRLFRQRHHAAALVHEDGDGLCLAAAVRCDLDLHGPAEHADLGATLLAGLPVADDEVQRWLETTRQAWATRRLDALAGLAERQQARGELAAALASAETLLALDPLLEHGWRRLMRLHHQRGDRAAAVAAFERCERVLRDELGLRPSPETLALLAAVETLDTAPGPTPTPLPPRLLRPPRMVGRQAELRALGAAWQADQAFVLVGEAGLGKSRLLAEFAAQRPRVLLVGARAGDDGAPFALLQRLLRRLHTVMPAPAPPWPEGPARAELARLLPDLGPAPAAPGLQALLHAALDDLFEGTARAGIEGVLIDDLHHADAASRHALQHAAAAGGPLHWGFAGRPGAALDGLVSVQRLSLQTLTPADVAMLLSTLQWSGTNPSPGSPELLATRLAAHCGGNPLFLLETLKHLTLHRDAPHGGPQEQGVDETGRLPLPPSVQAGMAARLARLSPSALALARVAAVAGSDFDAELAAQVLGAPLLSLAEAWQALQDAQVLHDTGFVHEALRDAVLLALPAALQRPLHSRVARALQQRQGAAAAATRHFAAARDGSSAAASALKAAADARWLGRTSEQLSHLDFAARAFSQAGDAARAFEARLQSLSPLLATQGLDAALSEMARLQALAPTPRQQLALHLAQADAAVGNYRADLVLPAAAAAMALATPRSRDALRAELLHAAGLALQGQGAAAMQALEPLRPLVEAETDVLQAAALWSQVALIEHAGGRLAACIHALEAQQRLARAAGDAAVDVQAGASLSALYTATGDAQRGLAQARDAAQLHRRMGESHAALMADVNLAIGLIGTEQLQGALDLLRGAAARLPTGSDLGRITQELQAEVWLRAARPDHALHALGNRPDEGSSPVRHINWQLLQAQAVQLAGDGDRARGLWCDLRACLPPGRSVGVRLRAAVLSSVTLPPEAARAELQAWIDVADQGGMPAAAGLARLRRAAFAWRAGELVAALADVHWLVAHQERLQHLYLPRGELLGLAWCVLRAAGCSTQAAQLQRDARRWFRRSVLPELPEQGAASWRGHPAYRGLF